MKIDALSQLLDVILDDLSARFIINLPEEELSSVTRICFGLEQAHWFYEDFFRPQYPALPSVNLRAFTAALFSHCPLLWKFSGQHEAAFDDFLKYKIRVPVRGAIMLNQEMDKCVLVKGWKSSAGWGFPKGKIDQGEDDADCAVREVREECGFDVTDYIKATDFVDLVMKEQSVRLYVVRGVPIDTKFEPQTRKEISKIDWFSLDDLPTYKKDASKEVTKNSNKYYMVAPFLGPLRRWIKKNKPKQKRQNELSNALERSETPTGTATPMVKELSAIQATIPSMDESSQALKLLLGIVPASTDESTKPVDSTSSAHAAKDVDAAQIDLASLFLRPTNKTDRVESMDNTAHHSEPTVPLSLLNTSIETSILDQIRPGRHQMPSDGEPRNPMSFQPIPSHISYQDRPQIHSMPLPPWMQPHSFGSPSIRPNTMHNHMMPAPPPTFHELQGHSQNNTHLPGMPSGPPGLAGNTTGLPQFQPSNRVTNPNAQSLLSILKPLPKHNNPVEQHMSGTQPAVSIPPPSGSHTAPVQHTQSLLALLRPQTQMGNTNLQHLPQDAINQPAKAPQPPRTNPATNSRDAFLLDYLMQASGGV